ncbi:protein of unknown function [Pseudomonas sp. JV551A1]|nr:protein of unknown function [Pseudomonas sp. JV551A1]
MLKELFPAEKWFDGSVVGVVVHAL